METVRMTGFDTPSSKINDLDYLDINSIAEGLRYTKIAYVQSTYVGLQRNSGGFVTFYLKDCNGHQVTARLFNVENFMLSGITASAFNHKPVKLTFVAQMFNGSVSLVIDSSEGIELYNGDFDYAAFIGHVESDASMLETVASAVYGCEWRVPIEWTTASFDKLCCGKAGAFAAMVISAAGIVTSILPNIGTDEKDTFKIFIKSMEIYFRSCTRAAGSPIVRSVIGFDRSVNLASVGVSEHDEIFLPMCDTVDALCNGKKPHGLEANAIVRAVELAEFMINAKEAISIIPLGSETFVGGVALLKY